MSIRFDPFYNDLGAGRLLARKVDEFMGIAGSFARQSALSEQDVRYLAEWLGRNKAVMDFPLIRPIAELLGPHLLEPETRALIHHELAGLVGDVDGDGVPDGPPTTIYDYPPPRIEFIGKRFCFTGTFVYGERWECEKAVEDRGAECGALAQRTHYLVVGEKITDAWKHATFGNKISQARAWQLEGRSDIKIVSEAHWVKFLRIGSNFSMTMTSARSEAKRRMAPVHHRDTIKPGILLPLQLGRAPSGAGVYSLERRSVERKRLE